MSVDPILNSYLPTGDKERDKNLAGGGGVFNNLNLNLYHYAGNNPLKYIDPNGKEKNPALAASDDFLYGFIKTVVENSFYIPESNKPPARDSEAYQLGALAANLASLAQSGYEIYQGLAMIELGAGLFGGGTAANLTGVGALVGVPAQALGIVTVTGGTAVVAHGGYVGNNAIKNLMNMMKGKYGGGGKGLNLPSKDNKNFTKLKGDQGWKEKESGLIWKKDKLHKDHWDVSDSKGNKIKEIDFDGNQIWPNGVKNKNK